METVAAYGWCPECDRGTIFVQASAYKGDDADGYCCSDCISRIGTILEPPNDG